ncbi:MAG: hypothetical protein R6T99_01255 [Bacteroidales bacterium]
MSKVLFRKTDRCGEQMRQCCRIAGKKGLALSGHLFLYMIISLMLLISCGSDVKKVIESTHEDGTPKTVKYYTIHGDARDLVREVSYYPDGGKRLEGAYENGKRDGKWVYWYENGNKWSEGYFKNGTRSGPGITYHENGQKYVEGRYDNDHRVGVWQFYDKEGNLLKEINYDN